MTSQSIGSDESVSVGCCSWFTRRRKVERRYVVSPHAESQLIEADRIIQNNTAAAAASIHTSEIVQSIEPPIKPDAASPTHIQSPSGEGFSSSSNDTSLPTPSRLRTEWSRIITVLHAEMKPTMKIARSQALNEWIDAQGFSTLLTALNAMANPTAALPLFTSSTFTYESNHSSDAPQTERIPPPLLTGASSIMLTSLGSTPPATSRWTRRQELNSRREQESAAYFNAMEQQQQYQPLDKAPSLDYTRRSSLSRLVGDNADDDGPMTGNTNRRHSSRRPLAMPAEVNPNTPHTTWSLPLDLSRAQELNQRQQLLQQQEAAATTTVPVASAHAIAGNARAVGVDPDATRSLTGLADAMAQHLVLAQLAELGASMQPTAKLPSESNSIALSGAASIQSSLSSTPNASVELGTDDATNSDAVVHPAHVVAWLTALVLLLKQLHIPMLEQPLQSLMHLLLPSVALRTIPALLPNAVEFELHAHLLSLMELTRPLLELYSMPKGANDFLQLMSLPQIESALLPPPEWVSHQCIQSCSDAIVPSIDSSNAWSFWVGLVEKELRHTAILCCYPSNSAMGPIARRSLSAALVQINTYLRWIAQSLSTERNDSFLSIASMILRLYPFLLHSLLDLFWSRLCGAHGREEDESALRCVWEAWFVTIRSLCTSITHICMHAIAHPPTSSVEHAHMAALVQCLRFESISVLDPSVSGVVVNVPPLVHLLTAAVSLLFDPVSHPVEINSAPETVSSPPSWVNRTQLAAVRSVDAITRLVNSPPFLRAQFNHLSQSNSTTFVDGSSSMLALTWFWDALLALFAPSTGCLYQSLCAALDQSDHFIIDDDEDADEMDACQWSGVYQFIPPTPTLQNVLINFMSDNIFSPGSIHSPSPCPWILDSTFVAAYLQMHYSSLVKLYHSNIESGSMIETIALAHLRVLQSAASIPSSLSITPMLDDGIKASVSIPIHVVCLTHIHVQLYHLGIAAWLASQISLEMDMHGSETALPHVRVSEMEQIPHQSVVSTTQDAATQSIHIENEIGACTSDGAVVASVEVAAAVVKDSCSDDDSSDFSDINFEDSDDEYDAPYVPPVNLIAPKLTIVQGSRHINEQFALGWDGKPLHPEAEIEAAPSQPDLVGDAVEPHSAHSNGSDDLGDDGWGESAEDVLTSQPPALHTIPALAPIPLPAREADNAPPEAHTEAPSIAMPLPIALPSSASYADLRSHHLLYRSELLHAGLIQLILRLCLDPTTLPEGHGLNGLYCQRWPLQASAEQQRLADALHLQQAALTAAGATSSDSLDEGSIGASMTLAEELAPLPINLLFALNKHVNHPTNRYLCPHLLRSLDIEATLEEDQSAMYGIISNNSVVIRQRSERRLMKLLFEQLFTLSNYSEREQIGRGRFASVYAATFQGDSTTDSMRVALKQVEQASSVHDQMCIVDLFNEISILDTLSLDAAANGLPDACITVLDFGIADGCFWIVMPLGLSSVKSFKLQQAELVEGTEMQQREQLLLALIQSLIDDTLDTTSAALVKSKLSSLSPIARRLLSSLSLFSQALLSMSALQHRDIVHFDLKADNFLMLPPVTDDAAPRVVLADFGEALFVLSSNQCGIDELTVGGVSLFSGARHALSRGTENIQAPEMLTLIRSLDRSDGKFDRRRNGAADVGSDIWSLGALFYELVMHQYGDKSRVEESGNRSIDDVGMSGSGLLFEEAGGLPIFLQVTSSTLPLLAEDKRSALLRPEILGPTLLAPCESMLQFVLRRDRLQRPSLTQVRTKFQSTVIDALHAALMDENMELHPRLPTTRSRHSSKSSKLPSQSERVRETNTFFSPSECWCTPPPSNWIGCVPPLRCELCTLSGKGPLDTHSHGRLLRAICSRNRMESTSYPSDHCVRIRWNNTSAQIRTFTGKDVTWTDASAPILVMFDALLTEWIDPTSLLLQKVFFLSGHAAESNASSLEGETLLQLHGNSAGGDLLSAGSSLWIRSADLLLAASFIRTSHTVELITHSDYASSLIALMHKTIHATQGTSHLAIQAQLRAAAAALAC
jgi:serine/threonine protein kinase